MRVPRLHLSLCIKKAKFYDRTETQRLWVQIPLRSLLEGYQCHPPPRGGTGSGEIDDMTPPPRE